MGRALDKTWLLMVSLALLALLPDTARADICFEDDFGIQFQLVKNKTNEGFTGFWTNGGCAHSSNLIGSTFPIGGNIHFGWTEFYGPAADCVAADYHGTWSGGSGSGTWYNRAGGTGSFSLTQIACPISTFKTAKVPKGEAGPNAQ